MKLKRKDYYKACIFFFMLVVAMAAINNKQPKEGFESFVKNVKTVKNTSARKLTIFKNDIYSVYKSAIRYVS